MALITTNNSFFVSTHLFECFVMLFSCTYLLSKVHDSLGFFMGTVALIALILRNEFVVGGFHFAL